VWNFVQHVLLLKEFFLSTAEYFFIVFSMLDTKILGFEYEFVGNVNERNYYLGNIQKRR